MLVDVNSRSSVSWKVLLMIIYCRWFFVVVLVYSVRQGQFVALTTRESKLDAMCSHEVGQGRIISLFVVRSLHVELRCTLYTVYQPLRVRNADVTHQYATAKDRMKGCNRPIREDEDLRVRTTGGLRRKDREQTGLQARKKSSIQGLAVMLEELTRSAFHIMRLMRIKTSTPP